MSQINREKLTPPELARLWGISPDKVLSWIRTGELRAINAAKSTNGRPRYLIDVKDVEEFENRRAVDRSTLGEVTRRKSLESQEGFVEYF